MNPEGIEAITADDLAAAWRTLMAVARNYEAGSSGEATLIEARHLVEVEVRVQHGDSVWATMTAGA